VERGLAHFSLEAARLEARLKGLVAHFELLLADVSGALVASIA
jgi:hypothetical protein